MKLELEHNVDGVSRFAREIYREQLPFATARAINWVTLDFQQAQREAMHKEFEVRNPRFVERAVKIKPFARKTRQWARVQIDPPGGASRRDILTKFEEDQYKTPFSSSLLAVPTSNVPRGGRGGSISPKWRIKNLRLEAPVRGTGVGSRAKMLQGRRRTFALFYRMPERVHGVIFERDGPELIPLYFFHRRVDISDTRLRFISRARKTVLTKWDDAFFRSFSGAVRTARTRPAVRATGSIGRSTAFSLGLRSSGRRSVSLFGGR